MTRVTFWYLRIIILDFNLHSFLNLTLSPHSFSSEIEQVTLKIMFCPHQGFLRIFTGHCYQISLVSFSITWLHCTTLTNMYLFLHNLLCTSTSNPSSGNFSLLWRATNIVSSPNRCLSSLIYNEKKQNII